MILTKQTSFYIHSPEGMHLRAIYLFIPILTAPCRFSWKPLGFGLQPPHSMPVIFWKFHFYDHKYPFHQRYAKISTRLNHQVQTVMTTNSTRFSNEHKKFKKNQNNAKPSRTVIICDIVTRKNLNLQYESFIEKVFSESWYHERTFIAFKPHGAMFWTLSWHSLSKCAQIWHMCSLWDGKQCCQTNFSTCLKKNHFSFFECLKHRFQ